MEAKIKVARKRVVFVVVVVVVVVVVGEALSFNEVL